MCLGKFFGAQAKWSPSTENNWGLMTAGASQRSPVEQASAESVDSLFELNVAGTLRLTRAVLPMLIEQAKSGLGCRIVVVGSMASQASLLSFSSSRPHEYSKRAAQT